MKKTRDVKKQGGEGGEEGREEEQHHQTMAIAQCKNVAQTQSTSHWGAHLLSPSRVCVGGGERSFCLSRVGENGIRNGKMFHVSRQSGRQAGGQH